MAMFPPLQTIVRLISLYKYLIILPIAILEGPIIAVISGWLSSSGFLSAPAAYGVLLLGDLIGDTLYYSIGRWGRGAVVRKWRRMLHVSEDTIEKLERHFGKHGTATLLLGKTQPIGGAILLAAGAARMPYLRFIAINAAGSALKIAVLFTVGYYFGQEYMRIDSILNKVALVLVLLLALGALLYWLNRRKGVSYE